MSADTDSEPLSLGVALRLHWPYLLGVAICPLVALPLLEFVPGLWFAALVLVFAALGLAAWPYFTKNSPYGFWLVAMVCVPSDQV